MNFKELPGAAWATIVQWTLLGTMASVAIAVAVTQLIMSTVSSGLNGAGLAAAVALPVLMGTPLFFYHLLRLQQLKVANAKLQVLASTDWLTTCLNRRAFTHLVTERLDDAVAGAFLVIDADHFKVINDRFGHDRGDEVLQVMAETIMESVREGDVVGRIGGEEFGVFLVDSSFDTARQVAERIRGAVAKIRFTPDGSLHPLSVSVGAAYFEGEISFSDLFRVADQLLYGAKRLGRNRIQAAYVGDHPPVRIEALEVAGAAA